MCVCMECVCACVRLCVHVRESVGVSVGVSVSGSVGMIVKQIGVLRIALRRKEVRKTIDQTTN